MMSLKVISRLLDYPSEALWQHRDELIEALEQANELPFTQAVQLMMFVREYLDEDLLDMQAQYCELFDRGRATSLLLFEHVHGESRDRGQAMVRSINSKDCRLIAANYRTIYRFIWNI